MKWKIYHWSGFLEIILSGIPIGRLTSDDEKSLTPPPPIVHHAWYDPGQILPG
jgi:hypothetical protein